MTKDGTRTTASRFFGPFVRVLGEAAHIVCRYGWNRVHFDKRQRQEAARCPDIPQVRFLAVAAAADPSPAERAFRAACRRGKARFDEIIKPASDALEPHIAAVAPQLEALERAIDADLAADRLLREEVTERTMRASTRRSKPRSRRCGTRRPRRSRPTMRSWPRR